MSQGSSLWTADQPFGFSFLSERSLFVPIGALLILTLQFQTLPLTIPIQTLPLTTVIALLALPYVVWRIPKSPLLTVVVLFSCFAFLHSVVALFIDVISGHPETRFIAWLRQFVALFAGVATFFVFRATLVHFSLDKIFRLVLIGSLPALLLSLLNILWGALKIQWAGTVVSSVREFVSPTGYTSPFRASGFAVEPAALATIIVILLVPALLITLNRQRHLLFTLFVLGLTVIVFVWTFSISGFILLCTVLLAGMILGPMRGRMVALVMVFLAFAVGALVLFPSNQVFRHARSIAIGQSNLSVNDRFYGIVGPFLRSMDSYSMIGYGLGGVSAHFDEVVPPRVQAEILAAKWKEYPTLSSIFGRTFAETGAVGLFLFLIMLWLSFWQLSKLLKHSEVGDEKLAYGGMRLALIAAYASMFISIGPYHTPYFWFWIAVVDAQYVRILQHGGNSEQG